MVCSASSSAFLSDRKVNGDGDNENRLGAKPVSHSDVSCSDVNYIPSPPTTSNQEKTSEAQLTQAYVSPFSSEVQAAISETVSSFFDWDSSSDTEDDDTDDEVIPSLDLLKPPSSPPIKNLLVHTPPFTPPADVVISALSPVPPSVLYPNKACSRTTSFLPSPPTSPKCSVINMSQRLRYIASVNTSKAIDPTQTTLHGKLKTGLTSSPRKKWSRRTENCTARKNLAPLVGAVPDKTLLCYSNTSLPIVNVKPTVIHEKLVKSSHTRESPRMNIRSMNDNGPVQPSKHKQKQVHFDQHSAATTTNSKTSHSRRQHKQSSPNVCIKTNSEFSVSEHNDCKRSSRTRKYTNKQLELRTTSSVTKSDLRNEPLNCISTKNKKKRDSTQFKLPNICTKTSNTVDNSRKSFQLFNNSTKVEHLQLKLPSIGSRNVTCNVVEQSQCLSDFKSANRSTTYTGSRQRYLDRRTRI